MEVFLSVITWLFDFLTKFPMQLLQAELLFCIFLPRRKFFWLRFLPSAALYLSVLYIFPDFYTFAVIGQWFSFSFAFIFLLSLCVIGFSFRMSLKALLFYGTAAYIAQNLLFSFMALFQLATDMQAGMILNGLKLVAAVVWYSIFYLFFVRRIGRGESVGLNNKGLLVFSLFAIAVINGLSQWVRIVWTFSVPIFIYSIVCCITLLFMQFGMFERTKLQKEKEIVEHLLYNEEQQRKLSKENIDLINIKCHDLKHQIANFRHTSNPDEEQEQSLREMENAVRIYDSSVKTGNETLDIVLTEKSLTCEKYGIMLSCMAEGEKLSFMSKTDIYSLFGNALDNAIEGVKKEENEENRFISLKIASSEKLLSVHMDNYYGGTLRFEDGLPVTTKEDARFHGFGVKSIRFIATKYNGNAIMYLDDNLFNLDIIFPLKENKMGEKQVNKG